MALSKIDLPAGMGIKIRWEGRDRLNKSWHGKRRVKLVIMTPESLFVK